MLSLNESAGETLSMRSPALEMSDIQATVLRPRPKPYCGEYVILRVMPGLRALRWIVNLGQ
jgi:hypothetical protein